MTGLAAARGDDLLPMLRAPIDPAPLLHTWRNADATTRGIREIRCTARAGGLSVRVVAVGPGDPVDWGEAPAALHADISASGGRATIDPVIDGGPTPRDADISATGAGPAFSATFERGFQRVHLQARLTLGVLVVAIFTDFTDGSGRADYFRREVFVQAA